MNQHFEPLQCGDPNDLKSRVKYFDTHLDPDEFLRDEPLDLSLLTDAVNDCLWPVLLVHFGFAGEHIIEYWCGRGCDLAVEFFQQSHGDILNNTSDLRWFDCYRQLFLLSCFCPQGLAARSAFSQFLQDDFQVEDAAIPIEPALGKIALLMASEYNGKLGQEVDIENAKPRWEKHSKSLLSAWNALKDGDRDRFAESLTEAVAKHVRKTKGDANLPITAIAILESAMLGRAHEKGWTDLKFPPEIAARLVTHQSLGLA